MKIFKKVGKSKNDGISIGSDSLKREKADNNVANQTEENISTVTVQPVSIVELYRYADGKDCIMIILAVAAALIQGTFSSVSSIIFKTLTDVLINGEANYQQSLLPNGPTFDKTGFNSDAMHAVYLYSIFGSVIFVLAFVNTACWHMISEKQVDKIRKKFFAAILRQDMGWYDVNETGALTTKMSDGLDRIKDGCGDKVGILFIYSASFCSGIGVAFYYSWKMSLIMIGFVPIIFLALGGIGFLSKKFIQKEMQLYGKAGSIAEEVIGGVRTVISFNGQQREIDRYSVNLRGAAKEGTLKGALISGNMGIIMLFMFVAMAVSFYFGTHLVIDKDITPGMVFAVFWAFIGGVFSLGQAAPQISVIIAARQAATEIFNIIDREPEIDCFSKDGKKLENAKGNILFKNISFRYPTRPDVQVLKGISFDIKAGEKIALVGHSGCGKSTSFGLLLRYYNQESGTVTLDGVDIQELNIGWLRNFIGVVAQEPVLFSDTIANNLKFGNLDLTREEMITACKMANAHDFIMKFSETYDTKIGNGGITLSGGQKQRLCIARTLARSPKILLLDEATSALDSESESIVQKALDAASQGRTTIAIAHRLSTIRNYDKIIVFDNGNIVEVGNHVSLIADTNGVYANLVKAQEIDEIKEVEDEENENLVPEMAETFDPNHRLTRKQLNRESRRLSRSMSITSDALTNIVEDLKEELKEEKADSSSLMEIMRFAKEEHLYMIISAIFSLVRGLTFPIFSIVYGQMFKTLTLGNDTDKLHGASLDAIWFTLIGVSAAISTFVSGFFISKAGENLTCRLRVALFKNIISQDGGYYDNLQNAPGKLTNRLATDAPNVRAAIDQRLADVMQSVSAIFASIVIAFTYGPNMAPIGILTAGTLIGLQTVVSEYLKRRGLKDAVLAEEPARLAAEVIDNHKTVQYLCREEHFIETFNDKMTKPHKRNMIRGVIAAVTFGLNSSYVMLNFAIAYRYGLWLILNGYSTPYTVFQVIESLNCATMSLLSFATYFPEYVRARLSAGLIFKMLSQKPAIDSMSDEGLKVRLEGNIKLDQITFHYPNARKNKVLNNLSLDIPAGSTVALVGPSGCGKSTIIQLIERLYNIDGGKVMFDEHDQKSINLKNLRSQIGLVGQEPILFNYSIKDNIAYGKPEATIEEVINAAKLANANEFITSMPLGYDTIVGEKGGSLSGGQKQRISIARSLILKPKVLLLDEATSSLDSKSEKAVQEALEKARVGRTSIMIAHRLSSIQNSDIIAVVKEGFIIEKGSHQELLQLNGLYASLISKQNLK
uniref:Multidrug resistance protein 1 n=1 Tax=Rhabditophanes sp. KR3021 TaxID=114890 RepID=A0AC35U4S4_9BILA